MDRTKLSRRQQLTHPRSKPDLRLLLLTIGTMAVPTTAANPVSPLARITSVVQVTEFSRTTTRDKRQHTLVFHRHSCRELRQVDQRRLQVAMAEELLQPAQRNASFEQMT